MYQATAEHLDTVAQVVTREHRVTPVSADGQATVTQVAIQEHQVTREHRVTQASADGRVTAVSPVGQDTRAHQVIVA